MQVELQNAMQHLVDTQSLNLKEISRFTPADFRVGIQWLVSEEQNDMAQALAEAGLALFPLSEDILAMAGLLAMTREDWSLAIELLQDLRDVQQERTQPMTYRMLARALFCNLDPADAVQTVEEGLSHWPQDADLLAERAAMASSSMALPASGVHS